MRQPILLCELLGLWTELRDMQAAHASRALTTHLIPGDAAQFLIDQW
jgi:hypothetical protein